MNTFTQLFTIATVVFCCGAVVYMNAKLKRERRQEMERWKKSKRSERRPKDDNLTSPPRRRNHDE